MMLGCPEVGIKSFRVLFHSAPKSPLITQRTFCAVVKGSFERSRNLPLPGLVLSRRTGIKIPSRMLQHN